MGRFLYRLWKACGLVALFGYELVVSNIRVAHDVLTPRSRAKPGIVAVPLDIKTDVAITVLGNLISLTPGSLSLEVASDRSCLYVHIMFIDDPEAEREAIKSGFERKVREVFE